MGKANAVVLFVLQASIFHKSVEISAFWQRYRSIRIDNFSRRVSMAIFIYNQKSFVLRRLRRYRLRHEILAIKTRPNNPLRFLQRKNSIRHYLANDLTCAARKATFRTQKRFHNKQYHQIQKFSHMDQTALILTQGLTTATLQCAVRPLFFFFFAKSQPFNKKQPTGTINHKNNPHNHSIKNAQNKHNNQLRKNAMFLNIRVSPTATSSEPNTNTLL